jgi:hypothetical protein
VCPSSWDGGVIGTLDVYAGDPRDWDPSEVAAIQANACPPADAS